MSGLDRSVRSKTDRIHKLPDAPQTIDQYNIDLNCWILLTKAQAIYGRRSGDTADTQDRGVYHENVYSPPPLITFRSQMELRLNREKLNNCRG